MDALQAILEQALPWIVDRLIDWIFSLPGLDPERIYLDSSKKADDLTQAAMQHITPWSTQLEG